MSLYKHESSLIVFNNTKLSQNNQVQWKSLISTLLKHALCGIHEFQTVLKVLLGTGNCEALLLNSMFLEPQVEF